MGDLKITLDSGTSDQMSMTLTPGKPFETLTIGRNGGWRIDAVGVSPSHAFFYFDGTTLFVAAADPTNPTLVAGKRATSEWTAVSPPSDIVMGKAMFRVAATGPMTMNTGLVEIAEEGEENATMMYQASMPEPPPRPPGGAAKPAPPSIKPPRPDVALSPINDESTRFVPIGDPPPAPSTNLISTVEGPPPGMNIPGMPTMSNMPPMGGMPSMSQMGQPAAPPAGNDFVAKLKADWAAASPPRKAITAIMPIAVIGMMAYSFSSSGSSPPTPTAEDEKPTPSASASASAKAPPAATPTTPTPADTPVALPVPVASGGKAADTSAAATAKTPAAVATKTPDKKSDKDKKDVPKTTERLAADAYSGGDLVTAARLYDQLAKDQPNNPAFKEAARIIHGKLEAPPE